MTEEHFIREGGLRFWPIGLLQFVDAMGGCEAEPWVVEFEYLEAESCQ